MAPPPSTQTVDFRLLVAGIEELDAGFTVFDAELNLVAANARFREMLGFPAALCVPGTPFSAFLRDNAQRGEYGPGEIEQLVSARLTLARQFLPHRMERVRPDGMVIDVRGRPLPEGGLVTIYTDITEERQREQALKALSEQLEQRVLERTSELQQREAELAHEKARLDVVMSNVPLGISLFNHELCLELANRQFTDVMRFPPAFCKTGTPFEDFIRFNAERGEYGKGEIEEQVRLRVEAAQKNLAHRFERTRPDGSAVEVIGCPTPDGGFVSTYLDVTDRSRAEAAVRASEARFRDFAQSSSDWFFETDAQLRVSYLSQRFMDVTGLPVESLIGKTREQIVDPGAIASDPEKWRQHRETLSRREPYRDFEYPLRRADGSWLHVRVNGVPAFNLEGRFIGYRGTGSDITQVKEAELRLRDSEAQLRTILEASPIGIAVVDRELYQLRFCNQRLAEQLGQASNALIGQDAKSFLFSDNAAPPGSGDSLCHELVRDSERRLRRADGSPWWALISMKPLNFQGTDCLLIWAYDISELNQVREQLNRMAHHDALTDLPNRRYFEIAVLRSLARAKRFNTRGALLYFDLDGFKAVNDTYGHAVGDAVLQRISSELQARLRASDLLARLGGDEFAVLVEDFCAEHADLQAFADELIKIVSEATRAVCADVFVGASVGVTYFDDDGPGLHTLMQLADDAMYRAKGLGKNTVCFSETGARPAPPTPGSSG